MKNRFSVLIPVYNREKIIRQTVDSVLSQTFTSHEVIVIDDGSTDETPRILHSYGNLIRVIRQANQGPEVARNNGATQADGEYLAFLDSDDLLLPGALETYERVIRVFNSPPLIFGAMSYFKDGQSGIPPGRPLDSIEVLKYRDFLSKEISIGMSSSRTVVRKSVFEEAGGFRNSTPATFHLDDYNLALRLCTYGPCLVVCQPTTVAYRVHGNNSIHNTDAMVNGILRLIEAEHQGRYPGGWIRRFARYSCIGGLIYYWSRTALKRRRPELAFRLVKSGWPMLMAGMLRTAGLQCRNPAPSIFIFLSCNDWLSM